MVFITMIKKKGENKLSLSSATTCIIRRISEVSVAKPKGMNEYHSRLAQKLVIPVQVLKHVGLLWNHFITGKKLPILPPLLINNKLESGFNSFFASKSTLLVNSNTVADLLQYVSNTKLSSFYFNEEAILKIFDALKS